MPYDIIGLMSGTSLDGLDIAYTELDRNEDRWEYRIIKAETVLYPEKWAAQLSTAHQLSGEDLCALDHDFGRYCGEVVNEFIRKNGKVPSAIASHGHTVFHRPEEGITLQIGCGAEINAVTGICTVCDFRSQDVALGGQGAPLVPVGDHFLFHDYEICLNMGGFSNLSASINGKRLAWDICPVNIVLNQLSSVIGLAYDEDGRIAEQGTVIEPMLKALEQIDFYKQQAPKSLGREWLAIYFMPILKEFEDQSLPDRIRTVSEHIALRIGDAVNSVTKEGQVLMTGGGALNNFLINRIRQLTSAELLVAPDELLHYKEAMIFAFLGVLRLRGEPNCFASVTGSACDHSTGAVFNMKSTNLP